MYITIDCEKIIKINQYSSSNIETPYRSITVSNMQVNSQQSTYYYFSKLYYHNLSSLNCEIESLMTLTFPIYLVNFWNAMLLDETKCDVKSRALNHFSSDAHLAVSMNFVTLILVNINNTIFKIRLGPFHILFIYKTSLPKWFQLCLMERMSRIQE